MRRTIINNIKSLCGILEGDNTFKKGAEMASMNSIDQAYLLIEDGKIKSYGPMSQCPTNADSNIDATDRFVLPGWCDSHTHIVFAASREQEFVSRIKGMSYLEIASAGGGILNSSIKMQAMDEDQLYVQSAERLKHVISLGTTSIEIKSGYGLTTDAELKMLRVIKRLKENFSINIKSTFLGAHAIPKIYTDQREKYIDIIINEMLPQIHNEDLADYIDVFCDKGFFSIEETDRILSAGSKYGLKAKIHANELANSGGVQIGVKHNAVSVDHLEEIGSEEIACLLNSTTIPTLLPSCSYFLNIPYAPARKMIDAGLGIAIASDYNPGTTPSGNIPLLYSIACTQLKLLPTEVFNAFTINGAHAIEVASHTGSITPGKDADIILTQAMDDISYIPYAFGQNHVYKVLVKGNEMK